MRVVRLVVWAREATEGRERCMGRTSGSSIARKGIRHRWEEPRDQASLGKSLGNQASLGKSLGIKHRWADPPGIASLGIPRVYSHGHVAGSTDSSMGNSCSSMGNSCWAI